MAVHTPIEEGALRAFLRGYDAGALIRFSGIAEGVENSNFLVETSENRFILTLFEQRTEAASLPFYMDLMRFLCGKGIACPQPIARRSGGFLGVLAERPAAMVSFLPGKPVAQPQTAHCAALGAALAELHLAGQAYLCGQTPRNRLGQGDWLPLWQKCREKTGAYGSGAGNAVCRGSLGAAEDNGAALRSEIDTELALLGHIWPRDLPQGIVHADLFPDNVFFAGGRLSGLIDFYFACADSLAYDIAICLNAWCFDENHHYDAKKGAALLGAYQLRRPLLSAELASLPILARGAALRFFLTRFHDWFWTPKTSRVTKKNPQEYVEKLRFFRAAGESVFY